MPRERGIKDVGLVIQAAWGAATGAVDSRYVANYTKALEVVGRSEFGETGMVNPSERELREEMLRLSSGAIERVGRSGCDIFTLPWQDRRISPNRLAAYLMAFTNDHGRETTEEFFPVSLVMDYLSTIQAKYSKDEKAGIPEQYALALEFSNDNPLAAAILCHSAYRTIARGSDTRVSSRFTFSPDGSEEVCINRMVSCTKDFAGQNSMDPLGNTYHFWSQFTAFSVFSCGEMEFPSTSRFYRSLFGNGPEITNFVRGGIMGKNQQFGLHKEVDMQGVRIGRDVGRCLANNLGFSNNQPEMVRRRQANWVMPVPRSW